MKYTLKTFILGCLATLMFSVNSADAQFLSYHLGVTGGVHNSNISIKDMPYNSKMNTGFGLAQEFRFSPFFSIQNNIMYQTLGGQSAYKDSFSTPDRDYIREFNYDETYNYATADLLFRLNIPFGDEPIVPYDKPYKKGFGINFFAGPQVGLLMGYSKSGSMNEMSRFSQDKDTIYYVRRNASATEDEDDELFVNPLDVSIIAGLGFQFVIDEKNTIGLDLRYQRSLLTIDYGYWNSIEYTLVESKPAFILTPIDVFHTSIGAQFSYRRRLFGRLY